MMPVMNGWDFMDEVKRRRRRDDLPVVVVSAYSERQAEGVTRVLKKPLDVSQLLAAGRRLLLLSGAQARRRSALEEPPGA